MTTPRTLPVAPLVARTKAALRTHSDLMAALGLSRQQAHRWMSGEVRNIHAEPWTRWDAWLRNIEGESKPVRVVSFRAPDEYTENMLRRVALAAGCVEVTHE